MITRSNTIFLRWNHGFYLFSLAVFNYLIGIISPISQQVVGIDASD